MYREYARPMVQARQVRAAVGNPQPYAGVNAMWPSERQPTAVLLPVSEVLPSVRLRMCSDGSVVDLPLGKTSIGSGPRCDIRIQRPGVHPIHCLIVRAADGLSVRRWAGEARLNGASFDDAQLAAGDYLSVASLDFEIVGRETGDAAIGVSESPISEAGTGEECWLDVASTSEAAACDTGEDQPQSAEHAWGESAVPADDVAETVFRELRKATAVARGRSRKLLAVLRQNRDNFSGLDERLANLERQIQCAVSQRDTAADDSLPGQLEALRQSLTVVERELAALEHIPAEWRQTSGISERHHEEWERHREEWQRQSVEWEYRLGDQLRRMDELEGKVATLQASVNTAPANVPSNSWSPADGGFDGPAELESRSAMSPESPLEQPVDDGLPQATAFGGFDTDSPEATGPAAFDWSSIRPAAEVEEPVTANLDLTSEAEQLARFSIWNRGIEQEEPTRAEPGTWDSHVAETPAAEPGQLPIHDEAETPTQDFSDDVPSKVAYDDSTDENDLLNQAAQPNCEKGEQTSFIARFAHMFEDEKSSLIESPAPGQLTEIERPAQTQREMAIRGPASRTDSAATGDEEESIEHYMAKLLQRVRGDSAGPASQAMPIGSAPSPMLGQLATPPPVSLREPPSAGGIDAQWAANFDSSRRKGPNPAPATDLEALRALANDTARRAISRHALRKHRRNALTKVIVSALAGMTSLWLMLQSHDWRSVQFVTACLALLVAAYWAGETFRTLLESLRDAGYEGPEEEMDEFTARLHAPLPIDIDAEQDNVR